MRLGFTVKVLSRPGLPSHDSRRWASGPHLRVSIGYLEAIFDHLAVIGVDMYRMSSNLAPYASHPDHPEFHDQVEGCAEELAALGRRARDAGLRLSTHPGQYVVLNSETPRVRNVALAELSWHARLMDLMGLGPEAVVVIHVGGAAPDRRAAMDRFVAAFALLPEHAQRRLVVENDDRTFCLGDVLELSGRIGRPVVFDLMHHQLNDRHGIPDREALAAALATWPEGVTPKIHYSSPKTAAEERVRKVGRRVERTWVAPAPRAHADLIDAIAFARFLEGTAAGLEFDVMLEAHAKDVALLTLRGRLAAQARPSAAAGAAGACRGRG